MDAADAERGGVPSSWGFATGLLQNSVGRLRFTLVFLARPARFELATPGFVVQGSTAKTLGLQRFASSSGAPAPPSVSR